MSSTAAGFAKMQSIMQAFRGGIQEFGGKKVVKLLDYAPGLDGLPKSDVLVPAGRQLLHRGAPLLHRAEAQDLYFGQRENKGSCREGGGRYLKSAEEYLK